jgi:hypothetical protein
MKGMNRRLFLSIAAPGMLPRATGSAIAPSQPPLLDAAFWKHWGDGQAELSGYDLTFPRYGQLRRGVAVTIFVTEPFSSSARVKADPGKHPAADEFPAMKLNLIEDYQTGIYDYNDMTSSFIALAPVNGRPAGSPVKSRSRARNGAAIRISNCCSMRTIFARPRTAISMGRATGRLPWRIRLTGSAKISFCCGLAARPVLGSRRARNATCNC